MLTLALESSLALFPFIQAFKYKRAFKKEHPYYFDPCGTSIFCGKQGEGKTLSAVKYINKCLEFYPYAILVSNTTIKNHPFNAHMDGERVIDNETGKEITTDGILDGTFSNVCVEYNGIDCLKNVNNGEYGVLFFIDEIHLEFNSLESKNIDIDIMVEISQQRKQRKHIVGTSQIFMRMAKPLREQINDIVLCRCYFGYFQINKYVDGQTVREESGKITADVKKNQFFFHSPKDYEQYDTYAKMKRYSTEWQGRSRNSYDPYNYSEGVTVNAKRRTRVYT